jgi:type I restriction enzyme S subunit
MKYLRVSLGNLLTLQRRRALVEPEGLYPEVGVYCFGRGLFHKPPRSGLEVGDKPLFKIRNRDFILQVTFAWEGAAAVANETDEGYYGSIRVLTFRVNETYCVPEFLLYYFKTPEGREQLIRISPGSAGRNRVLSTKRIPEVMIPLPPLEEQRRIVVKIEQLSAELDQAHILRRELIKDLVKLFLSEINRILAPIQPRCPLVPSGAAILVCGQHLSPGEQAEKGIPYITGPADFGPRQAIPTRFATAEKATARQGDVLLTVKGAGVGKVNLAPAVKTAIGRQLFAIRPNHELLDQVYLWYALQFCLADLRNSITATTVPGIGRKDVEHLSIPLPALEEQRSIVAHLDSLQVKVDRVKALQMTTAVELDALLPSVLDKAFKGEL